MKLNFKIAYTARWKIISRHQNLKHVSCISNRRPTPKFQN